MTHFIQYICFSFLSLYFVWAQDSLLIFPLTHGGVNDIGGIMSYNLNNNTHSFKSLTGGIPNSYKNETVDVPLIQDKRFQGGLIRVQDSIYIIENPHYHRSMEVNSFRGSIYTYNKNSQEMHYIFNALEDSNAYGYHPVNGFAEHNGYVYGYFYDGGQHDGGSIFRIHKTTLTLEVIYHFNPNTQGGQPCSQPYMVNDIIYGALNQSSDGQGYHIFSFNTSNLQFTTLLDSTGATQSKTIYSLEKLGDSLIYGVDSTLRVLNLSNTNENIVFTFPDSLLLEINSLQYFTSLQEFYIVSSQKNSHNYGCILKFDFDNIAQFQVLNEFDANAYHPGHKLLINPEGKLFGTLNQKGSTIKSDIFKVFAIQNGGYSLYTNPDNNFFSKKALDFIWGPKGITYTGYTQSTYYNGDLSDFDTTNSIYLSNVFAMPNGANPFGLSATLDSSTIIYPIFNGGYENAGGFLRYNLITKTFSNDLVNIVENSHTHMTSNLIPLNNEFFCIGALKYNASKNDQSLNNLGKYYIYPDQPNFANSNFQKKKSISISGVAQQFNANSKVDAPLVHNNTHLFGLSGKELFSYEASSNTLTSLQVLDSTIHGYDAAFLIIENNILYGVFKNGGTNGFGSLFQYHIGTNSFSILHHFDNTFAHPANITFKTDTLWGTCDSGGTHNLGGVFLYDLNNTNASLLHHFNSSEPHHCSGSITLVGNEMYTLANQGGSDNKGGLIHFNIQNLETLLSFDNNTGYGSYQNGIYFYLDTISYKPNAPQANTFQAICTAGATLNDINITGVNIKWYDAELAGNLLAGTTPLQDNSNYYASQTINGIESYFRTRVHVSYQELNTSVTQSGDTLKSLASKTFYQWVDCDNNMAPALGANQSSFIPGNPGNYAVELNNGVCTLLSNCTAMVGSAIPSNTSPQEVTIYPNPFNFGFTILSEQKIKNLELFDLLGKTLPVIIHQKQNHYEILPQFEARGLLILQIQYEDNTMDIKRIMRH